MCPLPVRAGTVLPWHRCRYTRSPAGSGPDTYGPGCMRHTRRCRHRRSWPGQDPRETYARRSEGTLRRQTCRTSRPSAGPDRGNGKSTGSRSPSAFLHRVSPVPDSAGTAWHSHHHRAEGTGPAVCPPSSAAHRHRATGSGLQSCQTGLWTEHSIEPLPFHCTSISNVPESGIQFRNFSICRLQYSQSWWPWSRISSNSSPISCI